MKIILSLLVLFFIALGCQQPSSEVIINDKNIGSTKSGISYAKGFTIEVLNNYKFITVFNPWNNDTLSSYLLLYDSISSTSLPTADFIIHLPVKNIACLSSTGIGILNQLKSGELISAASDAYRIYDSSLYRKYLEGHIKDLGNSTNLNTEVIIEHNPDLIIKYIYGGKEIADDRLKEAGIPVAYHLEFMESHPLGRAEWIKFIAAFIGQTTFADSLFSQIETSYLHYSSMAKKEPDKPTVLDGSCYKGVWHAAGGQSFPAQLYADAGGDYFWKDDKQTGSIALSFESIIENQINADYWIGASSGSKNELLNIESRYALLQSFKRDHVFYHGKRKNPNGGLDYYESGVIRPDILLTDLIWVFHPHLLDKNYVPAYIERIK